MYEDFRTRKWKIKNIEKSASFKTHATCRKWMLRGDGLEICSAISIAALSLHYLHLYKFWRYLEGYNYLLSSALEAISASSLCRYLHRRHHLRLFQRFRLVITSKRTLLNILWYMRPCTSLSSSQFNHIYYFSTTISSPLSKSLSFWRPNCDT